MKEKLELVKFNLTEEMSKQLIKFNNLKKELLSLKQKEYIDNKDLIKIKKLEDELNITRIKFIKDFRKNNQEEIIKYLEIKDQF